MGLTKGSSLVVSRRDLPAYAERVADRTIVWLNGEHDASTVAALWEVIARAIALDDDDLVIDLSGVEFMGSATVGLIMRARDALRPRSRRLTLRCPSRCAARVLDLYGLSDRLEAGPVDVRDGP
jgi:anti-anti-sigma factor